MNPEERWHNDVFGGYAAEKMWMSMDVIFEGCGEMCRQLEIALIRSLREVPGCNNVNPGGEGIQKGSRQHCYAYYVLAPCGDGISLERAYVQRMHHKKIKG